MNSDLPVGNSMFPLELADILLVEDDPVSVQLTSEMLGFIGCRVVVLGSGLAALSAMKLHQYALVLMDCRLPEMSGPDVTRALREIESRLGWPATPIVALTAGVMPTEIENYLSSGMNGVLRKPLSLEELKAVVLTWCTKPRAVRPVVQLQTADHDAFIEATCGDGMEGEAELHVHSSPRSFNLEKPLSPRMPSPLNALNRNSDANTEATLAALFELFDGPADDAFDRITRLTVNVLNFPIAMISLLDGKQQQVKSPVGWTVTNVPISTSFCAHAIAAREALVVRDTWTDARFVNSPMVRDEPSIRFYAGHPIHSSDGTAFGTLCVMDRQVRAWSPREELILADLAAMIEREIAHRESDRLAKRAFKK